MNESFRVGLIVKATNKVTSLNINKRARVVKIYQDGNHLVMDLIPVEPFFTVNGNNWTETAFNRWRLDSSLWEVDYDFYITNTLIEVLNET